MPVKKILVIGGTGYLGGKVIDELLKRKLNVFALVRPDSDASKLEAKNVSIVRGDLTDKGSLSKAIEGKNSVITTAIGYANRKKGDTLESVDDIGNKNLIDVIADSSVSKFIFTSVLSCDQAQTVPHFWQKKLTEDYMAEKEIPYIALRPGAFLDQNPEMDIHISGLKKGIYKVFGPTNVKWSYILTEDIAKYLAIASIDESIKTKQHIEIGMDELLSREMICEYISEYTGKKIKLKTRPWPMVSIVLRIAGLLKPVFSDAKKMFDYFFTGKYIGDFTKQIEFFDEVPSAKESVFKYCKQIELTKNTEV